MSSNSGREGYCVRCGRCSGRNGQKKCKKEWIRCTTVAHNPTRLQEASRAVQYIDCYRCPDHPGAPPGDFWGTQPEDQPSVPTADEVGLPRPGEETTVLDSTEDTALSSVYQPIQGEPSGSYHQRTFSDSTDPLHWDEERFARETTDVAGLAETLSDTHINESQTAQIPHISSAESYFAHDARATKRGRVAYTGPDGRKHKVEADAWIEAMVDHGGKYVECWLYTEEESMLQVYTYTFGEAEGSSSSRRHRRRKN
ncbi:unnamed protein product [Clonostachys chloroleuca]|uniref:Uncharacterized protein n=1 Tax=Clonostachys chloroleuca TaxID=1926264 RepID=A0AA35LSN4_9HYPO|nr:unnamed protein product [Clonostachys chloroleuca]